MELLSEGGLGGHMSHLYDNPSLTFSELKDVFKKAFAGELEGTEKTDGQNLFLSYDVSSGKAKAARNEENIMAGGLDASELASKFAGRGTVETAFNDAFAVFEKAVAQFTPEERVEIFGPDTNIYYNSEVQDPRNANVINYDFKSINIHRTDHGEFDKTTGKRTERNVDENAAKLEAALNRVKEKLEGEHAIQMDAIRKLEASTNNSVLEQLLDRLEKVTSAEGISDNQTIGDYLVARVSRALDKVAPDLSDETKELLMKRIFEVKEEAETVVKGKTKKVLKNINIRKITDSASKEQTSLIKKIVDSADNFKKAAVMPLEEIVHDLAVEVLEFFESIFVIDNSKEAARLRKKVEDTISKIEASGNEKDMNFIKQQMLKLKSVDKITTAAEGFVFSYNGHTYKLTGSFAPVNQILGLLKYEGRVKPESVEKAEKLDEIFIIREEDVFTDGPLVAVIPGGFKPPHRGHFEMVEHYADIADKVVVYISPLPRQSKDGKVFGFEMAKRVFELYCAKNGLSNVEVQKSTTNSPVRASYEYVEKIAEPGEQVILGTSTKGGDESRFAKKVQDYAKPGVTVLEPMDFAFDPIGEIPLSATDFREAISRGEDIEKFLPDNVSSNEFYEAIGNESLSEVLTNLIDVIIIEERKKRHLGKKVVDSALLNDQPEEELDEMSAVGAGAVQGYGARFPGPGMKIRNNKKK